MRVELSSRRAREQQLCRRAGTAVGEAGDMIPIMMSMKLGDDSAKKGFTRIFELNVLKRETNLLLHHGLAMGVLKKLYKSQDQDQIKFLAATAL